MATPSIPLTTSVPQLPQPTYTTASISRSLLRCTDHDQPDLKLFDFHHVLRNLTHSDLRSLSPQQISFQATQGIPQTQIIFILKIFFLNLSTLTLHPSLPDLISQIFPQFLQLFPQILHPNKTKFCTQIFPEGILYGMVPAPSRFLDPQQLQPNPDFLVWERYNRFIMCWIYSSLSKENMGEIVSLDAAAIWESLKRAYDSNTIA